MAITKSKQKRKRFLIRMKWKRRREMKKSEMLKEISARKSGKKGD